MTSTGHTRTGEARPVAVSPTSTAPAAQDRPEPQSPHWWQRPFRSLRARVLLSYVLLLGLSAIVTSLLVPELLAAGLRQRVAASLGQEVLELERLHSEGRDPSTGEPFRDLDSFFDVYLYRNVPNLSEGVFTYVGGTPHGSHMGRYPLDDLGTGGGVEPWAALASEEAPGEEESGTYSTELGEGYYLAHPISVDGESGLFVVVDLPAAEHSFINALRTYGLVVSLLVMLIATAVAWPIAGRVLKPVRQVAETARAISSSDLSRRVEVDTVGEAADMATAFNAMLDRLQAVLDSQREFMRIAGHELRDPVTIGLGHLDLLRSATDDRAARATLDLVLDELTRMGRIVTDLQVLAADQQQDFLRPETVDLTTLTHELIAKASQMAPDRTWVLDGSADGEVRADRHRITEAVMNLVHNSVNATAPADTIAIGTSRSGAEWRLWVRDSGVGIEPDPQLFEPGYRGPGSRRRYRGSGLGLATVRLVAEAHGGSVELRSAAGDGTTITMTLPVSTPARAPVPGVAR